MGGGGFRASYYVGTCRGSQTVGAEKGTLNDGSHVHHTAAVGGDRQYYRCRWLLAPAHGASSIAAEFTRISLALKYSNAAHDHDTMIRIWDGRTTSDPLLLTLTRHSAFPSAVLSSGAVMLVEYRQRGLSYAGNGFSLKFHSRCPVLPPPATE